MAVEGVEAPPGRHQHHLKNKWEQRRPVAVSYKKALSEIFPQMIREGQCIEAPSETGAEVYLMKVGGEPCGLVVRGGTIKTFYHERLLRRNNIIQ